MRLVRYIPSKTNSDRRLSLHEPSLGLVLDFYSLDRVSSMCTLTHSTFGTTQVALLQKITIMNAVTLLVQSGSWDGPIKTHLFCLEL